MEAISNLEIYLHHNSSFTPIILGVLFENLNI